MDAQTLAEVRDFCRIAACSEEMREVAADAEHLVEEHGGHNSARAIALLHCSGVRNAPLFVGDKDVRDGIEAIATIEAACVPRAVGETHPMAIARAKLLLKQPKPIRLVYVCCALALSRGLRASGPDFEDYALAQADLTRTYAAVCGMDLPSALLKEIACARPRV